MGKQTSHPFDVPGTVTLNDVKRPVPQESPAERDRRLARKAVIEGVRIFTDRAGIVWGTSARGGSGTNYRLDLPRKTCDCPGFRHHGYCKHLALATIEAEQEPAEDRCEACGGEQGFAVWTGTGPNDWIVAPCRACTKAVAA